VYCNVVTHEIEMLKNCEFQILYVNNTKHVIGNMCLTPKNVLQVFFANIFGRHLLFLLYLQL